MENTTWLATGSTPSHTGRTKARRLLLEQLRQAIATEPATLEAAPNLPGENLSNIRGRVSIMIGTIVVRLNREGFGESDRLYQMRDNLASGRPVRPEDVAWLEGVIAAEGGRR